MSRREIVNESLKDSRPKIDQNFAELYNGLAEPILWEEIEGKPEEYPPASHEHSHFEDENNPHSVTREQVQAAPVYSQVINIMPDSGRFAGKVNPQSLTMPDTFVAPSFFGGFNGATISNAGKFINNNTTNGGTRGELTEDVAALLSAMGREGSNARYGVEFYVLDITAGTGTAASLSSGGVAGYLLTSNGSKAIFGFGNYATLVMWTRLKSGGTLIVRNRGGVIRSGVPVSGDVLLTPSDGWTHLSVEATSPTGYDAQFPYLYASSGDVVQVACAAVFSGQAFPGVHTAPLPSFNEMVTV